MIDQAIHKIRDREIFRCLLKWKREWRDIFFFIRYLIQRKRRKEIEEFVLGKRIYFCDLNRLDIFGQHPFEEKLIAIGHQIDCFVFEIEIVRNVDFSQKLKKYIKVRSIDYQCLACLDISDIVFYFCKYIFFRKIFGIWNEYFLKEGFLLIEICLEPKIEFIAFRSDIDDGVSVIDAFGRSRAVGLSFTSCRRELCWCASEKE